MASGCHLRYVYNEVLNCKIYSRNEFCIPQSIYQDILDSNKMAILDLCKLFELPKVAGHKSAKKLHCTQHF